jgi:hypothetical protein
MRDDFTEAVKRVVANRVNNVCSNPGCLRPTTGPQADPSKFINIGVAAHITAASPGGPRYSSSLSAQERKHSNNAIWLCQVCAKLVDNDDIRFSENTLRDWKWRAEVRALASLERVAASVDPSQAKLTQDEMDLLVQASRKGDIYLISTDQIGVYVEADNRAYMDETDPAFAATYVEALESLVRRRLARFEDGELYSLTGTGFRLARALKASLVTPSESIES